MPFDRYQPYRPLVLEDRSWPDRSIEKAPRWCSVDLRDGNQALIEPMDPARKLKMFQELVRIGFKEVEVGFPAASQPDFDFIRQLIDEDRIPDDVTIQVLSQSRDELIERTYDSIEGSSSAIVHFYNSTNPLQREVVFDLDKEGIEEIAVNAAKLCRKLEESGGDTVIRYEYSPESFTLTESPRT
jgi:2-isopropylmalate synthase